MTYKLFTHWSCAPIALRRSEAAAVFSARILEATFRRRNGARTYVARLNGCTVNLVVGVTS